jgi:hypothetical protein
MTEVSAAPTAHEQRVLDALRAEGLSDTELGEGILSVKLGFNPNSSSVGSLVSVLFWSATGAAILANLVAASLVARRERLAGPPVDDQTPPEGSAP